MTRWTPEQLGAKCRQRDAALAALQLEGLAIAAAQVALRVRIEHFDRRTRNARPALSLLAALEHADAFGESGKALGAVGDWLGAEPKLDPDSEAGRLAVRVRRVRDGLASAEGPYAA